MTISTTHSFRICFFLAIISITLIQMSNAQVDTLALDSDSLFSIARIKAFNGEREYARYLCRQVLKKSPGYTDVRILIARTLTWDGRKTEARTDLRSILKDFPDNTDATIALLDLEYWDDRNAESLIIADSALRFAPENEEILFRKARALAQLQRDQDAMNVLLHIYQINKNHVAAGELRRTLALQSSLYTAGVDYSFENYSRTYDPMHYASLTLSRRTSAGSFTARLNLSRRFGKTGIQEEVDFYPGIASGMYGYLNYGFSGSNLYPRHRFGAEFFSMLPASFEGSLGFRYLYFDSPTTVFIYTGSVGWYYSDYWFSLRVFLTPWEFSNGEIDISRSLNLTMRYYFPNPENYLSARIGGGFSPDQRRVQTNTGMSGIEIFLLKSQSANFLWQQALSPFTLFTLSVDYAHQELSFSPGEYVNVFTVSAGFRIKL